MKVVKNLQVWPKVDRAWINLKLEVRRCSFKVDRKRKNRPVFYLYRYSGRLPFKVDIGKGLTVQPKMVLMIYHPARTNRERVRALAGKQYEVQSP